MERFAEQVGARSALTLAFADRIVVLIEASAGQLSTALNVLDDLAELRRPRRAGSAHSPSNRQPNRLTGSSSSPSATSQRTTNAPAACVLDTGTYAEHPLLAASLAAEDCHACDPAWSRATTRATEQRWPGLALFGTLDDAILAARQYG